MAARNIQQLFPEGHGNNVHKANHNHLTDKHKFLVNCDNTSKRMKLQNCKGTNLNPLNGE